MFSNNYDDIVYVRKKINKEPSGNVEKWTKKK